MPLRRARPQPCAEGRHRDGFEVPEHGDERERCADERGEHQQQGRPSACAAAPQRAEHEWCLAERAADRACRTAGRLVPLAEDEPDRNRCDDGDDEPCERPPEGTRRGDPDRGAEADEDPDRVPVPHAREVTHGP